MKNTSLEKEKIKFDFTGKQVPDPENKPVIQLQQTDLF